MKKLLIVLGAMAIIIAAALVFWPRIDIPEDASISLLYTGEDLSQRYLPLDAAASTVLRSQLDGRLLLPDWTDVFTGQRFYYSSAHACQGMLIEWESGSLLLVLPKHGSHHLLQVLGGEQDELLWLDSDALDALAAIFDDHGAFYPPTLE